VPINEVNPHIIALNMTDAGNRGRLGRMRVLGLGRELLTENETAGRAAGIFSCSQKALP